MCDGLACSASPSSLGNKFFGLLCRFTFRNDASRGGFFSLFAFHFSPAKAFTLAELMIVFGILGIIAETTIPSLINNVMTKVYVQSASSVLMKIEEATKQMNTASLLSGYATNEAFVDAFQKYVKTNKRCISTELTKCFAPTFKTVTNVVVNTSDLSTGADFSLTGNSNPLVGLQFADGSSAIMAYNPTCVPPKWYDTRAGSYSSNSIYSPGASTACLSMVYDTNGFRGPNKIGKDVQTFNATLSTCDGVKISGLCVATADIAFSPTHTTEDNLLFGSNGNYWAGAKIACSSVGMRLPTQAELDIMYAQTAVISMDKNTARWASEEYDIQKAWNRSYYNIGADYKSRGSYKARCVK